MTMSIDDNNVETLDSYDEDAKFVFYVQHGTLVTFDPQALSGAKLSKAQSGALLDGVLASIPYPSRPVAGQGQIKAIVGTFYYGSRGLESQAVGSTTGFVSLEDGIARFVSGAPDFVPFTRFNGPWPGVYTSRIGGVAAFNHWRSKGWYWTASNQVNLECKILYGGNPYTETCEGVNLGPLAFNTSTGREMACPSDRLDYSLAADMWTRTVRPTNELQAVYLCCRG